MSTAPSIIIPENSDETGLQTEDAGSLNKWICDTIEPFVQSPTLEMGSGLGAISAIFAEKGLRLSLSEDTKSNRDALRVRFLGVEEIRRVIYINFCRPDFESHYSELIGTFGAIIALNVMENGFYDRQVLLNARRFLRQRGRLIFIAPVFNTMFNGWEGDPDAIRQLNRHALKDLLKSDFEVIKTRYLNLGARISDATHSPLGLAVLAVVRQL
jgi:SAM-dependent methyltransferase